MSVVRNTFTGTLSESPTGVAHTITGLTSETSTTNVNIVPEASLHFLNALYQTLLDAGYDDTVKNESEYSISILGFKFFILGAYYSSRVYIRAYTYMAGSLSGTSSSSGILIISNSSPYTDLSYNITVRGDSGHASIYVGSSTAPNTEYNFLSIAKGKNLITSSDIYMFSLKISGSQYILEKNDLYTPIVKNSGVYNAIPAALGANTNSQFVCIPQVVYNNTILIPSMVQGNTKIFTAGKYYKIGTEVYYNEEGFLYKVG